MTLTISYPTTVTCSPRRVQSSANWTGHVKLTWRRTWSEQFKQSQFLWLVPTLNAGPLCLILATIALDHPKMEGQLRVISYNQCRGWNSPSWNAAQTRIIPGDRTQDFEFLALRVPVTKPRSSFRQKERSLSRERVLKRLCTPVLQLIYQTRSC